MWCAAVHSAKRFRGCPRRLSGVLAVPAFDVLNSITQRASDGQHSARRLPRWFLPKAPALPADIHTEGRALPPQPGRPSQLSVLHE